MSCIFYIFGKSASGKDSIYREILKDQSLNLKGITIYTTRPMRTGDVDGKDYFFVDDQRLDEFRAAGRIIEQRTYQTVYGLWHYATIDDGQFDDQERDCLMVGVLESYRSLRDYFGAERVIPIYIEVEDGERLIRAIRRERMQEKPKYEEMCRRFLADAADFSEDNLAAAGIVRRYENHNLADCVAEITGMIREYRRGNC